jgi:hypothetical protein
MEQALLTLADVASASASTSAPSRAETTTAEMYAKANKPRGSGRVSHRLGSISKRTTKITQESPPNEQKKKNRSHHSKKIQLERAERAAIREADKAAKAAKFNSVFSPLPLQPSLIGMSYSQIYFV